jgi:hypothetical protein
VFSGDSAEWALPAASRIPTRPGSREVPSQAVASSDQRSAVGRRVHASNSSVGANTAFAVVVEARRHQPGLGRDLDEQGGRRLVDVQVDGRGLELAHAQAPRPELGRRVGAPVVEEQLEAAHHLERRPRRGAFDHGVGALGRRQRRDHVDALARGVAAPQRDADLAGHQTCPPLRGTRSRRASSSSAGVAASSGSTVWRADPAVASPPLSSTCSSNARAGGLSSASRASTSSRLGGSGENGRSPPSPRLWATPRPRSATPPTARRPPGDSQARARSIRRSTAATTDAGAALTTATRSAWVV